MENLELGQVIVYKYSARLPLMDNESFESFGTEFAPLTRRRVQNVSTIYPECFSPID